MTPELRENLRVVMSADDYHRYMTHFVGPWDDLLMNRLKAEYEPGPRRTIVDMGTGTAVIPIKLAGMADFAAANFLAMDFFGDMTAAAREAVRAAGLSGRISVVRGDAHHMPFATASADYIISRSTLHHLKDPAAAFHDAFRILRPGGIAIIHDPRRDPNPEFLQDFNQRRLQAGFQPNDLSEKFTVAQVDTFLQSAGIRAYAKIYAPQDGPASLGYEVRIEKPQP